MMKKRLSLPVIFLAALMLLISAGLLSANAQQTRFDCEPSAVDDGAKSWWVGTNLTVTPTGGSGFTMASDNGTAVSANAVWGFTVEQLKQTPIFNIEILQSGSAQTGPYLKMFYGIGAAQITNPDFLNAQLDNWVLANSKVGKHAFNLLNAVDSALTDDTVVYFNIYVDPNGTNEALKIGELFLSEPDQASSSSSSSQSSSSQQSSSGSGNSQPQPKSLVCTPLAISDEENSWWVGDNLNVVPGADGAFTMASENGTAAAANVVWGFTVGQLREMPYFNFSVLNSGAADTGPYMKTYFYVVGGSQIPISGFTSDLENWVRANAKKGSHSVNLLEKLGSTLPPDDTQILFYLWVDPFGSGEGLKMGTLSISNNVSETSGNSSQAPVSSKSASSDTSPKTGMASPFLPAVFGLFSAGLISVAVRRKSRA